MAQLLNYSITELITGSMTGLCLEAVFNIVPVLGYTKATVILATDKKVSDGNSLPYVCSHCAFRTVVSIFGSHKNPVNH